MDEIHSDVIQESEKRLKNWCNANRDILDALMGSQELLQEVREFVYSRKEGRVKSYDVS